MVAEPAPIEAQLAYEISQRLVETCGLVHSSNQKWGNEGHIYSLHGREEQLQWQLVQACVDNALLQEEYQVIERLPLVDTETFHVQIIGPSGKKAEVVICDFFPKSLSVTVSVTMIANP